MSACPSKRLDARSDATVPPVAFVRDVLRERDDMFAADLESTKWEVGQTQEAYDQIEYGYEDYVLNNDIPCFHHG